MVAIHKYETFWKRFLAGVIDGLIFLPLSAVGNYLVSKTNAPGVFIACSLVYWICWTIYVVTGHGKYGQTLGKRVMNIKVLDLDEINTIGYARAFLREAIWFFVDMSAIIYFTWLSIYSDRSKDLHTQMDSFDTYVGIISIGWLITELVTMMFNNKRRALHDYIAGSVVVDVNELKHEELQKRHNELLTSLKNN